MFTGLDHVTLLVADLAQATADYAHVLGSGPLWRGSHPALGSEASIFALSNTAIELIAALPAAPESEGLRAVLATQGEGILSLSFVVADASEAQGALRARGLRVAPPEEGEALGPDGQKRSFRTLEISRRTTRGISIFGVERSDLASLRKAAPGGADCVHALDHVALRTRDPDAVRALYEQGFGLRLALDRELGAVRMLFFRTGKVTLEFVSDASVGDEDKYYGLAFRVKDIEGARARLRQHGVSVSEVRVGHKPGTQVFTVKSATCGVPTLFLQDPARDA